MYFIAVLIVVINAPFEMGRFQPDVSRTIDLIKTRLNISSIQCNFKSTYIPISPSLLEEKNFTTSLEAEFGFNEEGNFYLCYNMLSAENKSSMYRKEDVDNSPLYNFFYKQYLKQQSLANYQAPKILFDCSYLYKGKPFIRDIYKKENIIVTTEGKTPFIDNTYVDYNGLAYFGDPRYHIGYITTQINTTAITYPYKHLSEFLEKEGYYSLSHRDGSTILWHKAFFEDIGALFAEIWIDSEGNIHKIRSGVFPLMVTPFSLEEAKQILGMEELNCDSFSLIDYEIEFYDFKEFDDKIRVPMLSIRTDYVNVDDTEYTSEEREKMGYIEELYKKGKIDKPRYRLMLSPFLRNKKLREITIQIDPETLSINKNIPEDKFIPPEITMTRKELFSTNSSNKENTQNSWYSKYYPLLFIGFCMTITLILIAITKKYLGWSF